MGLNCPTCGGWYEGFHQCPSLIPKPTYFPMTPGPAPTASSTFTFTDFGPLYLRIALALERIANALEQRLDHESKRD